MKTFVLFGLSVFCFSAVGCSGSVDELPPAEAGQGVMSPEDIQKQMEESMKKGGANYGGGQIPGSESK